MSGHYTPPAPSPAPAPTPTPVPPSHPAQPVPPPASPSTQLVSDPQALAEWRRQAAAQAKIAARYAEPFSDEERWLQFFFERVPTTALPASSVEATTDKQVAALVLFADKALAAYGRRWPKQVPPEAP